MVLEAIHQKKGCKTVENKHGCRPGRVTKNLPYPSPFSPFFSSTTTFFLSLLFLFLIFSPFLFFSLNPRMGVRLFVLKSQFLGTGCYNNSLSSCQIEFPHFKNNQIKVQIKVEKGSIHRNKAAETSSKKFNGRNRRKSVWKKKKNQNIKLFLEKKN